ncbi:extracellular solute-binding protein [Thermoanaerobacterium thermosaccharolyticum]|uniref:Carbohydrate ABC transporter substrate-binding protein, CUT1 family n=1 Tax=Thermoanaerobacterium thermosaccharolyticum M0795 TaxID=698948 RepID=L0IL87_THETR|nr:extracellular solute-binding protein [Thermoanaerobacterium thermosaccharolyticum]AGB19524.1 carbohydrate ABC transporter substrate-binding protein, CUT1 family [Thermoanaerobacterium thermosaccharolyticum M0795]
MKSKKLLSVLIASVMIFSVFLSGCGSAKNSKSAENSSGSSSNVNESQSSETVTITFWHTFSDEEDKLLKEQIIPDFEKKYPNIKVDAKRMPSTDTLRQQVITAVSGNAVPDVMRMDIVWVSGFAKLGALQEVDNLDGFDEIKNNSFAGPLATNYYNGHYYGIPQDTNTKIALYNKTLLQQLGLNEPPKTFDDLVSAAEKLKSKDKWGIGIGGTSTWGMAPYFLSLGGKVTDDKYTKATGYLNSPESVAALQKLLDLYNKGLIAPTIIGGKPDSWGGMKGNNYLMIDDGPWYYSIQGDSVKNTTVPALFPQGSAGSISVVGGEDLVLFKGSKHPKEAWTFMKYMFSETPQKILAKQAYLIPTNKVVANSEEISSDPILKLYVQQMESAWPRTPSPNWDKIDKSLSLAFEKVFRHVATPQKALDDAAREIDVYLKNN